MTYQDVGLPPQFSVSKGDVYKQEFLPMILWLLAMLWSFPLVQGYYSLIAAKIFFFFQNYRFHPYSASPSG